MKGIRRNVPAAGGYLKSLRAVLARARKSTVLLFGILTLSVSSAAFAASNVQGSISGEAIEADGSALNGASVTVINLGTGFTRTEQADEDGYFVFSALPVGQYRVIAESGGSRAVRDPVVVSIGTGTSITLIAGEDAAQLAGITVTGTQISPIDIRSTESATVLGEQTIDRIPVLRDITDIALLAPGTTKGDSDFGNLASFGGATVGENVCYINGLNVTDFRNGLGCSSVPFEFYREFQIKTGGYSAEFGRSTGGVLNAVTKSGTNEFHYGASFVLEPFIDGISGYQPNTYLQNGQLYVDNADDEASSMEVNLWASGPIMKDKAFFYVLYNPRDEEVINQESGEGVYMPVENKIYGYVSEQTDDSAFWGLKLDFNITYDHVLELTAFSDEAEIQRDYYLYDNDTEQQGAFNSSLIFERGGVNWGLKYTGYLTPDFTLSALYGENNRNHSQGPTVTTYPIVDDYVVAAAPIPVQSLAASSITQQEDTREAMRIDAEWMLGDHQLRFGIDDETNTASEDTYYSGGGAINVLTGEPFPGFVGNRYQVRGTHIRDYIYYNPNTLFETTASAIYVEDKWQVSNDVVLSIGLRNESFTNNNAENGKYIEMSNQLAPRLGISWDAFGDGTLKLFANYGRYFLPVATNSNIRQAGREYYTLSFYEVVDADGDGLPDYQENGEPVIGDTIAAPLVTYGSGDLKSTLLTVNQNLEPMYQDELIFGFMKDMGNNWSLGMRAIRRDLKSTLEDIAIDAGALAYAEANGYENFVAGGFDYYVMTNPGFDVSVYMNFENDINGDGIIDFADQDFSNPAANPQLVTFSAEDLGFPKSERYYNAVELLFERSWDGVWFMQGSYTWSQSYGNNEGFVRSDNGQDDAGLTTLFDQPGLLDNGYGYLPNDRRHAFKLFGAWQFADHWQVGANLLMESGRPINAFGYHPSDAFASEYHSESFFQDGVPVPRGSRGRTAFTSKLDLSLKYMTMVGDSDLTLGVDLINVFNSVNVTEVDEVADLDCPFPNNNPGAGTCVANPSYGLPTSYKAPRVVQFRAEVDF